MCQSQVFTDTRRRTLTLSHLSVTTVTLPSAVNSASQIIRRMWATAEDCGWHQLRVEFIVLRTFKCLNVFKFNGLNVYYPPHADTMTLLWL